MPESQRNLVYKLLVIVIFTISLVIRFERFDYPLSGTFLWGDGTRDYLVANHIVKYGEFPLLGPFNLLSDSGIKNSPIYYYSLALFLISYNNILTLSAVNIFLQFITLIFIYLLTKKIFGRITALIALVLFSFNSQVLSQADFIWQPHIMQPVFYLALYLSVIGFLKSKRFLFLTSVSFFALGVALHNSAASFLPLFLTLSYKRHYLISTTLVFLFSSFAFHLPVFIFYLNNISPTNINIVFNSLIVQSIGGFLNSFYLNSKSLLDSFGLNFWIASLLAAIIFFVAGKTKGKSKTVIFLILFGIITPVVFASLFNNIRVHYLSLSFGPIAIVFAKTISSLLNKPSAKLKIAGFLLFIFLFKTFSFDLEFLREPKKPLENQIVINQVSQKIETELLSIQKKEKFNDLNFFQIFSYIEKGRAYHYPILDTLLLVPLEKGLNRKFTKINDFSPYNYVQTNEKQYAILSCPKFAISAPACLNAFLKDKPDYFLIKEIYTNSPLALYLTKRL